MTYTAAKHNNPDYPEWTPSRFDGNPVDLKGPTQLSVFRLDAAQSVWFARELEFVDTFDYREINPATKSKLYIPTQTGIPIWAQNYIYHMTRHHGEAQFIGANTTTIPRVDVSREEKSRVIKMMAAGHGWDIREVKQSAQTGVKLDIMKAASTQLAIEQLTDRTLANGSVAHGLEGLLNLSDVVIVPPGAKIGGGFLWSNATSQEIVDDIHNMSSAVVTGLADAGAPEFHELTLLLPVSLYSLIAQKTKSEHTDTTILKWVLGNNPFIKAIEPWNRCSGAGAGGTSDRAVIYPRFPAAVAGILPMKATSLPVISQGLEFITNVVASCGGVVVRYPLAVKYMDELSVTL